MIFVIFPIVFFALGSICTSRCACQIGATKANSWRLALATVVLGVVVLVTGGMPESVEVWGWLLLSGVVGLGLGDLCMMFGYRHVGPRITALVLLCLAMPITGITEWVWLGTTLSGRQILLSFGILAGVGLAVAPGAKVLDKSRRSIFMGVFFGVLAAVGQGVATTISRVAYQCAADHQIQVLGISAAWQRMIGGLLCALVIQYIFHVRAGELPVALAASLLVSNKPVQIRNPWFWVVASALLGPIIGLSIYQWVLLRHPGALVQAMIAITPVVVIPLAWLIDGDKPEWRGIAGGLLACTCAILLVLLG
jgi:drug/metabolite transporter (DMT)-like permease